MQRWQPDDKLTSLIRSRAENFNGAAMQIDKVPHQRKAHAEAVMKRVGRALALREKIENIRQHVARDPGSIVDHAKDYIVAFLVRAGEIVPPSGVYLAALFSKLPRT